MRSSLNEPQPSSLIGGDLNLQGSIGRLAGCPWIGVNAIKLPDTVDQGCEVTRRVHRQEAQLVGKNSVEGERVSRTRIG